jgi:hypothetical protein
MDLRERRQQADGGNCIMNSIILYCSQNIKSNQIKEDETDGRGEYKMSVMKLEIKRPLGRSGLRWKNSIKMDLKAIRL